MNTIARGVPLRQTAAMNEIELAAGMPQTPGYRYAEVIGDRLLVAGQVPRDSSGSLVGVGDVGVQAAQCLTNLFTLVEAHGFERDDVRRLTIHVVGSRPLLSEAWVVVARAFDGDVPPATLLGAHSLGYDEQLVEIDAHVERRAAATR
jgi:enamine deaminase RidA (YjgF/YER057c/UK114 family)